MGARTHKGPHAPLPYSRTMAARRFEGKVICITGAGGTFGQVGSVMFAELGAKIVAVDMAPKGLEETEKLVKEKGGEITTIVCNVTKEEDIAAMVAAAVGAFGK